MPWEPPERVITVEGMRWELQIWAWYHRLRCGQRTLSGRENNLSSVLEASNCLALLINPEQSGSNIQHKTQCQQNWMETGEEEEGSGGKGDCRYWFWATPWNPQKAWWVMDSSAEKLTDVKEGLWPCEPQRDVLNVLAEDGSSDQLTGDELHKVLRGKQCD